MSTLTSAQLHVKRSSTRLHAPPGGVSSLSFGYGGLGSAAPQEEMPQTKEDSAFSRPNSSKQYARPPSGYGNNIAPNDYSTNQHDPAQTKEQPTFSRPTSSNRYAPPPMSYGINNNNNAPSGNYPGYSTPQHDPAPYKNNYAPQQQLPQPYQQQPYQAQVYQHQPYQQQPVYNPTSYGNNNYGNNSYNSNSFSNPIHAPATGPQAGRPPSSRSSCHSSSSSRSWGSQPPLTSSKRDQNWEKKRRLWLARKNSGSGSNFGESRPPTSTSTWSGGNVLDDAANPPSPLTKFMHQHAQQQQQQPPPSPTADFQRIGTASGNFPPPLSYSTPGQTAVATARQSSRGGLSTASSTSSSSGRRQHQPPGGHCQWSLG